MTLLLSELPDFLYSVITVLLLTNPPTLRLRVDLVTVFLILVLLSDLLLLYDVNVLSGDDEEHEEEDDEEEEEEEESLRILE